MKAWTSDLAPEALAWRLGEKKTPGRVLLQKPLLELAERTLKYLVRYHRGSLKGARHIPEGPALLVGNHGRYGYETLVFFWLVKRATGRYPLGMADKIFFRMPLARELMPILGGIPGTRKNALEALSRGELIVAYPGGAKEVFKSKEDRYQLHWESSLGFARVASEAQSPVVPFAGYGVDHTFLVAQRRFKLLKDSDRYVPPLFLPVPLPARMTFYAGEPLDPPRRRATDRELSRFRDEVARRVQKLIVRACHA